MFDYLIVGAGFAGSVLAERLASGLRQSVLLIDRSHIGGNAYDHLDGAGVLVHKYGPHIFHTNSRERSRELVYGFSTLPQRLCLTLCRSAWVDPSNLRTASTP